MAGIELATAYVHIIPSARGIKDNLARELAPASAVAAKTGTKAGTSFMGGMTKQLRGIAGTLGIALGGAALFSFFKAGIAGAEEYRRKQRLVAQAIESTGGAANVTSKDVDNLAAKLGKQNAVTKGTVLGVASLLLRYQQIKNVGADKVFDRTAQSALDLSAATGRDATSSVRMLARALNDPVAGMGALGRAQISFTTDQKESIKKLAQNGDLLGAQGMILDEVARKYGGAAQAAITPTQRLSVAFKSFRTGIGNALLPAFDSMAEVITGKVFPALKKVPDLFRSRWGMIGPAVANIASAFRSLWTGVVNLWHTLQPTVTILAGVFIGALRVAASLASTLASALRGITGALSGQKSTLTAITVAVLAMWAAWKAFTIAKVAIAAVSSFIATLAPRIVALGISVATMSLTAVAALGVLAIAVGAGVFLWNKHSDAQKRAAAESAASEARVQSLTEAIKADNGALADNVKLAVAKELQDKGAYASASRLGISLSDVTDAAMGNHDAWLRLDAAQRLSIQTGGENADAWDTVNSALNTTGMSLDAAKGGYAELASGMGQATTKADGTTTAMQTQEQAAASLKAALDELSGKALTEAQSELQLQSGIQSMTEAIKDNGKSLDAHDKKSGMFTAGALANRQALLSNIQTINDHAQTVMDSTGSTEAATAALGKDEAMLRAAAVAAGFNSKEVDALIKMYAAVPKDVSTALNADTSGVTSKTQAAKDGLNTGWPTDTGAVNGTATIGVGATAEPSMGATQKNWEDWYGDWKHFTLYGTTVIDTSRVPGVPHARGGYLSPGWNLVGEQGPELISPAGLVHTATETARMLAARSGSGGGMRVAGGALSITADSQGKLSAWVRDLVLAEDQFAGVTARMGG